MRPTLAGISIGLRSLLRVLLPFLSRTMKPAIVVDGPGRWEAAAAIRPSCSAGPKEGDKQDYQSAGDNQAQRELEERCDVHRHARNLASVFVNAVSDANFPGIHPDDKLRAFVEAGASLL